MNADPTSDQRDKLWCHLRGPRGKDIETKRDQNEDCVEWGKVEGLWSIKPYESNMYAVVHPSVTHGFYQGLTESSPWTLILDH